MKCWRLSSGRSWITPAFGSHLSKSWLASSFSAATSRKSLLLASWGQRWRPSWPKSRRSDRTCRWRSCEQRKWGGHEHSSSLEAFSETGRPAYSSPAHPSPSRGNYQLYTLLAISGVTIENPPSGYSPFCKDALYMSGARGYPPICTDHVCAL